MNWLVPMEPILTSNTPEEGFIHQVKWDGIRGLCYIENGKIRIYTKKGRERTDFYPELSVLPSLIKGESAVLDGEIIILNKEMKPSFQLSLIRERVNDLSKVNYYSKKYPIQYIVFDIMFFNGKSLTEKPLMERDSLLRKKLEPQAAVSITDNYYDGASLFALMKERGWEGIVSKRADSPYLPGKAHNLWFKTKLSRRILAIVIGLTLRDGVPNSLVLAISVGEVYTYIGRASIGLSQEHFRLLKDNIAALMAEEKPVNTNSSELKDVVWLKPQLTVWVSFLEWTSDGGLRHPKIQGFTSLSPEEANGTEFVE